MASLSCSSWCAELKASSRISVSFLSFSQSSDRNSDTALSPFSPSSAVSMILEKPDYCHHRRLTHPDFILLKLLVYLHRRRGRSWCSQRWREILTRFSSLMSHLWWVGSWRVRGGDLLNVGIGFGAFFNTESFVKGAPQLHANIKRETKSIF